MYDRGLPTLIILSCLLCQQLLVAAVLVRRNIVFDGPYYNSTLVTQHQLVWGQTNAPQGVSFEEHVRRNYVPSDFLYFFTGDTQFWFPCTSENLACHQATEHCDQSRSVNCTIKMAEFANKIQQVSMMVANRRLRNTMGQQTIRGMVINGDLTDYGHLDQLQRLEKLWTSIPFDQEITVYPGLGNHDYANNVGDCSLDSCVVRMLTWFKTFINNTLHLPLDLRSSVKYLSQHHSGSLAYSWDECPEDTGTVPNSSCYHFIQLNLYPTYAKHISGILGEWKILPSLNWLKHDLRQKGAHKSIIINFHDFDSAFSSEDKKKFRDILDAEIRKLPNTRILAMFFAHIHSGVGVKEWWCVGGRKVPMIYSGSVPGNNYMIIHFSPHSGTTKTVYIMRVKGENVTEVEIEDIPSEQEACAP